MNFYVIGADGKIKAGSDVTSVNLVMPDEFSVANSPVTTSGEITVSKVNQNANLLYAGPVSGSAAAPTFRPLIADDVPSVTPPTPVGSVWSPDAPPVSPSSLDDEFDDASFNTTLWTEYDPSNTVTINEAAGLILTQPSQSGTVVGGIYQALPSGDFTVWTKVSLLAHLAHSSYAGLALFYDPSDPDGDFHTYTLQQRSNVQALQVEYYLSYAGWWDVYTILADGVIGNTAYLRIRRNGSTYYFDWSSDGIGWIQIRVTELENHPQYVGLHVNNFNTGADIRGLFGFFRYTDSDVGLTGIMGGQRATLYQ